MLNVRTLLQKTVITLLVIVHLHPRIAGQSFSTSGWTANGINVTLHIPNNWALNRGDLIHWIFPDGNFQNMLYSGSGPVTVNFRPTGPYAASNRGRISVVRKGGPVPPPPVIAPIVFSLPAVPSAGLAGVGGTRLYFPQGTNLQFNNAWDWAPNLENYLVVSYRNGAGFPGGAVNIHYDPTKLTFLLPHSVASYGEQISIPAPGTLRIANLRPTGDIQVYLRARVQNMGAREEFNLSVFEQTVYTGTVYAFAHDPNYKLPDHKRLCARQYAPQPTGYEVRFQNIGNWYANDVSVVDYLPAQLIPGATYPNSSFGGMSYTVSGNLLKVNFAGINLPGLGQTYPNRFTYDQAAHIFRIETSTLSCLPTGAVRNYCEVYFDNLAPVLTNIANTNITAENCIAQCLSSSSDDSDERGWDDGSLPEGIRPNPSSKAGAQLVYFASHPLYLRITDTGGRTVYHTGQFEQLTETQGRVSLPASELPPGMYLVQLTDMSGKTQNWRWIVTQ